MYSTWVSFKPTRLDPLWPLVPPLPRRGIEHGHGHHPQQCKLVGVSVSFTQPVFNLNTCIPNSPSALMLEFVAINRQRSINF